MAGRFFFAIALVAVHSFTPAFAGDDPTTITTAPKARRTPSHHDLAKRQAAPTFETTSPLPLTQYTYPYTALPEQVYPFAIGRGPQSGTNRCNSTTEGPNSECQTLIVNTLVCLLFYFGVALTATDLSTFRLISVSGVRLRRTVRSVTLRLPSLHTALRLVMELVLCLLALSPALR
jgi:hypothetical protein